LAFGGEGLLQSNDPAGQEKAIIYNELVANAVALQNAQFVESSGESNNQTGILQRSIGAATFGPPLGSY